MGDNDRGFHHGHAIKKPLATGNLDSGDRGVSPTHTPIAGKVMPLARVAEPRSEITGPIVTTMATSKPPITGLPKLGRGR